MTDSNKWRKPKPKEASTRRGGSRPNSGRKSRGCKKASRWRIELGGY